MSSKYFVDPLDSDEFDSVQYINQKFPTGKPTWRKSKSYSINVNSFFSIFLLESSLDDLDSFIVDIGAQISKLDDVSSASVFSMKKQNSLTYIPRYRFDLGNI